MRLCHAAWVKSPHISLSEHVNSYFPSRNEKCYSFEREHDKVRWTTRIWGKAGEKYFALFHCSNLVSVAADWTIHNLYSMSNVLTSQ